MNPHHFHGCRPTTLTSPIPAMNLSARKVRDEQVKRWIANFGKEEPGDHRALKGVLTIFASVLEENLRTPGARKKVAYAFIHCARAIDY